MPLGEKVPLAQMSSSVICFVCCAIAQLRAANRESRRDIRFISDYYFKNAGDLIIYLMFMKLDFCPFLFRSANLHKKKDFVVVNGI